MSALIIITYVFIPIALIVMFKKYRSTNWLWLGFLIISVFIGIAGFVALAYLVTAALTHSESGVANQKVSYKPDGSYVVYQVADTMTAPSPGRTAFRIVGGILAGASIAFGLLFVGIILLFTLAPSVLCGGSSKCM